MMRLYVKIILIFTISFFLITACNERVADSEPIVVLNTQNAISYPKNTVVTAIWNSRMCQDTICYFSVFEDGRIASWHMTNRRNWAEQKNLTDNEFREIKAIVERLKTSTSPTNSIGTHAVQVVLTNDLTSKIECGNRNCPILVRRLFSIVGDHLEKETLPTFWSPFADESFHILSPSYSSSFIITWFENLQKNYMMLTINDEGRLVITKREDYESPEVEIQSLLSIDTLEQIQSCQESLHLSPQAITGEDMRLIKVSFAKDGSREFYRFDEENLPPCLQQIFVLVENEINQTNPGANYSLNPRGFE